MGENEQGGMLRIVVVVGLVALIAGLSIAGIMTLKGNMEGRTSKTTAMVDKSVTDNATPVANTGPTIDNTGNAVISTGTGTNANPNATTGSTTGVVSGGTGAAGQSSSNTASDANPGSGSGNNSSSASTNTGATTTNAGTSNSNTGANAAANNNSGSIDTNTNSTAGSTPNTSTPSANTNGQANESASNTSTPAATNTLTITPQNDPMNAPSYHLGNVAGFMNDIQTIRQDAAGTYHLYYLNDPVWGVNGEAGGSNWQEATSTDLTSWTNSTNLSIHSKNLDNSVPWGSVATGSTVISDGSIPGTANGDVVAYFSSYGAQSANGQTYGGQSLWAAVSKDNGKTFTSLNDNRAVINNTPNYADFRDPFVMKYNGKWTMYTAEGNKIGTYQSNDGLNWWYVGGTMMNGGAFTERTGDWGMVECPHLEFMTGSDGVVKAVMFFGGNDYVDGHSTGTYYMVGHVDDTGTFVKESDPQVLDGGTDYYGANFGKMNDGSVVTTAWVNNWGYAQSNIQGTNGISRHEGTLALLRKLELIKDSRTLSARPYFLHADVIAPKASIKTDGLIGLDQKVTQQVASASIPFYEFKSRDGSNLHGQTTLSIRQDDNAVDFYLDFDKGTISSSRWSNLLGNNDTFNKQFNGSYMGLENRSNDRLQIFIDNESIELYNPDTHLTYTVMRVANANKKTTNIELYPVQNADLFYSIGVPDSVSDQYAPLIQKAL